MNMKEMINKFKLSPLQFLFLIAGIVWLIVIAGTVYNLPDIPKTARDEIRNVITKDTTKVADLEFNKGKVIPGVQISAVLAPNEKLLAMGEASFKSTCASCHGEKGFGDGAGGAMLNPKPRNFHEKTGWKNGREMFSMFKTLQEGIAGSGMNAFEFLPVEELFAIIYYIRSFTNDFPPVTEEEVKKIDDTYDITRDKKGGASIPVAVAENKIIKEHNKNIDDVLSKIEKSGNAALTIFEKITSDKRKAIQTLSVNKEWQNNLQNFSKIITSNVNINGFKASASRLTSGQLSELQSFLKNMII
ncbi:cytochrome c [Bacteroidetes/Chlorobi group bacterium ChocPot_Mid]|jgi:mono/diheme cytochrome c family protein|nr:MAG: cytochrome c [Bacteroidetes/Chlorobi group bacterium ChocPot_Mid]